MTRRAVLAFATVACLLGVALPVGQLRIVTVQRTCCCPDPDRCHCPDHAKPGDGDRPTTIQACHRSEDAVESAPVPAFVAPARASAPPPARVVAVVVFPTVNALAPPEPRRPEAPS